MISMVWFSYIRSYRPPVDRATHATHEYVVWYNQTGSKMATLAALPDDTQLSFTYVRDQLNLTDGNLGSHLRKLEDARYIAVTKAFVGRKPQTYLQATQEGRRAFAELEAILNMATVVPVANVDQPIDGTLRLEQPAH
jgi:DNA-binding MarR family transcriptional regulator